MYDGYGGKYIICTRPYDTVDNQFKNYLLCFLCWCAVYWHKVQELHEQTINHVLFVMKNWRMQS